MRINRRTVLASGIGLAATSGLNSTLLATEAEAPDLPKGALILVAQLKAKAGEEDAVKAALLPMVAKTRQEPGCLCYNLHQSKKDKTEFMFYEQWASQEALDAHGKTSHMQQMQEGIRGRIESGVATAYDLLA